MLVHPVRCPFSRLTIIYQSFQRGISRIIYRSLHTWISVFIRALRIITGSFFIDTLTRTFHIISIYHVLSRSPRVPSPITHTGQFNSKPIKRSFKSCKLSFINHFRIRSTRIIIIKQFSITISSRSPFPIKLMLAFFPYFVSCISSQSPIFTVRILPVITSHQ